MRTGFGSNRGILSVLCIWLGIAAQVSAGNYDPLAVDAAYKPTHLDFAAHDASRNRQIPLRVYLPAIQTPAPVILFSHGLGGSRAGSAFLGEHWARRGYVAVFVQHPGSDDSVWRGTPTADRMADMRKAASLDNFLLRVKDIPAVLDQLAVWQTDKAHSLSGRMDLNKVGMSGHSFGAVTTQAVSGEAVPVGGKRFTDPRIKAAVIFSPSSPRGFSPKTAFASVSVPWMLMTGTKDLAPIGNADMKSRLSVYPALKGAPKYELVLNNAEHSVFTDRPLPGDQAPRNPNHHQVILALSTTFWDAYLRGDSSAKAWLNGTGPRSVMAPEDHWQFSAP